MDFLVADVENNNFKIETELNEQFGALPLPFNGMDKSTSAVCTFFYTGECEKSLCPFRHIKAEQKTIVCKHWLRALCKKGDSCEFLHEYDMTKMPECYFYSRFNTCHKKECTFLHIDPESKIKDCPWYDRGFCRHGPGCRHRHVRRVLCKNYLAGFCPDGSGNLCKFMHPRFELPPAPDSNKETKRPPICHYCGELGHKASFCQKLPPEQREAQQKQDELKYRQIALMKQQQQPAYNHHLQQKIQSQLREQQENAGDNNDNDGNQQTPSIPQVPNNTQNQQQSGSISQPPPNFQSSGYNQNSDGQYNSHFNAGVMQPPGIPRVPRPLQDITCFKCGMKGHYANRCSKGYLAFLSSGHQKRFPPPSQLQQPPPQ